MAGAMSMAVGKCPSVNSRSETERADRERLELADDPWRSAKISLASTSSAGPNTRR
jgi:hypothetical protein